MTIIDYIKENKLLEPGDCVLCAVSGGADSMCLLHYLSRNSKQLGIEVFAASFDHMLRGEESASDCQFVAQWCRQHDIECIVGNGDVRAFSKLNGLSEEEAARKLRYDFLNEAADELNCNIMATAHNANDNAETMLLNLTRGSGLKGLCGIPPQRGKLIRPLLGTTRQEIEEYNEENGIEYVTDKTNLSDDYTRNVVRHHVTPVLENINPSFFDACARTTQLLREDEAYLDELAHNAYAKHYKNNTFSANVMTSLPKPVAMRVLRLICGRALSYNHAKAVYDIASSKEFKSADICGMRVVCDRGMLYFGAEYYPLPKDTDIQIGESRFLPDRGMNIKSELIKNCTDFFQSFNILSINYDSLCGNISLTSRRPGDKVRLAGRGCTKSVKDLFSEAKLNRFERDMTPILRDEKGIVAVYGFGIAERCIASPGDNVLRVTINKIKNKTKHMGE